MLPIILLLFLPTIPAAPSLEQSLGFEFPGTIEEI